MKPQSIHECSLAILQLVKLTKPARALLEQRLSYTLLALADQFTYLQTSSKAMTCDDPFGRWLTVSRWSHQYVEESDKRILRELFYGTVPHVQDDDGIVKVFQHYRTPHRESIPEIIQFLASSLEQLALDVA